MWSTIALLICRCFLRRIYRSSKAEPELMPRRRSSYKDNWENPCRPKESTVWNICTSRNNSRKQNVKKGMSSPLLSYPLLSSPLPHACPPLPLHAATCGCFLSLCAEECMTPFQDNAVLSIYPSQGISGEPEVKKSRDCFKNPSGRTADE